MQVDPKVTWYIGLGTCIALVLSNASIWTGAVPADFVHYLTSWNNLIGQLGTAVMTFLAGASSPKAGPLVSNPK